MTSQRKFGYFGIGLGSAALLLALVHFWAGPFSPQPTLETTIAEKAASIRTATLKALKGEDYKEVKKQESDVDRVVAVLTAVLGAAALIASVVSFANQEPKRVAVGGAILGVTAIAFQFLAMFAMALLFILLVCAVLVTIDAA